MQLQRGHGVALRILTSCALRCRIPGRFYPIAMLFLQFTLLFFQRDFGPMFHAERRACLAHFPALLADPFACKLEANGTVSTASDVIDGT